MKANTVFDKEFEKWVIYVDADGEIIPVGRRVNENLGLFKISKFDSKEEAMDWIRLKPNMEYDKDLVVD